MCVHRLCWVRRLLNHTNTAFPQPASTRFALLAVLGVVLIVADDFLFRRDDLSFVSNALTDELAHAATALLCVGALYALRQWHWDSRIWIATVIGGTIIDLDHVPAAFGWNVITIGTDRPYSHSLLTLGILLLVTMRLRSPRRDLGAVATWGLASHYIRDMVDGGAVPLFWPITKHGFTAPYVAYGTLLLVSLGVILVGQLRDRERLTVDSLFAGTVGKGEDTGSGINENNN